MFFPKELKFILTSNHSFVKQYSVKIQVNMAILITHINMAVLITHINMAVLITHIQGRVIDWFICKMVAEGIVQ